MRPILILAWLAGAGLGTGRTHGADSSRAVDACNVVWTTPSTNSSGSMPLGNGDLGMNLWVEQDGDLRFYLSKSDARDHKDDLLKLGAGRVQLEPNPFRKGRPFRQELRLRQGEIAIRAGETGSVVELRAWVDANRPAVHLEVECAQPVQLRAQLEVWRDKERVLSADEASGADQFAADDPPRSYPDTVVAEPIERVVWYHRNERSIWPATLKHQGLESLVSQFADPLLGRTFGGVLWGTGLARTGPTTLASKQPGRRYSLTVVALTAQTKSAEVWRQQLDAAAARVESVPLAQARIEHGRWWADFWGRSWVRVTRSGKESGADRPGSPSSRRLERNQLPLRLGADSDGANRFQGGMTRASVFNRALTAAEVRRLASGFPVSATELKGCVGEWDGGSVSRGVEGGAQEPGSAGISAGTNITSRSAPAGKDAGAPAGALSMGNSRTARPRAQIVGAMAIVVRDPNGPANGLRFSGDGYVEVAHSPDLDLTNAVSMAVWVRPEALPGGGGRLIDKSQAGTSNGYLLDTFPGNSLRLIVADGTLSFDAKLPTNRWTHVAAVFDARTGEKCLYVDGQAVTSGKTQTRPARAPEHEVVTRGYALQRFITACAGRGALPIKFNGSIFTVDVPGKFNGDYRAWGGCYWFQNTRLPYWPLLASGDFDLIEPLFRMYRDALPLARARTPVYYGHEGAFFPETMHFWGVYHNGGLGYGWNRTNLALGLTENQYIRYHWSGGLELLALMLDYCAFAGDRAFVRETLLPHAEAVLEFYARHYPRDAQGRLLLKPSQALETWWECENPTPEVAGLHVTLGQLLALPSDWVDASRLVAWRALQAALPPIPQRAGESGTVVAPAQKFAVRSNMENPELYAIFPFRVFGVGKPELELARRTFAARQFKGNRGWQQDETQAALLGLTDEARRMLVDRFATKHEGSRFPAFWGPNFDWIPDQDHGGNGMMALETMLLQCEGRRMLLLPAWPRDWDVEFKLHAPFSTTVEGAYRRGKITALKVVPASRRADIVLPRP